MFRDLSLRQRVMLLALLPTLTISLLLGTTFTLTRLQDLEQALQNRATLISEQLAPLAAQVIERKDPEMEQQILRRALEQPDVRSATLYDRNGNVVGHSGPQMLEEEAARTRGLTETTEQLEYDEGFRILRPLVSHSGFFLERVAQPHQLRSLGRQRVGWMELEFSRDGNQVKIYQTFLASGLLIQAGILLNLLLALSLGRKITRPLQRIIGAVKQIRDGNFETRLPVSGGGELARLSHDINAMTESMQNAHQELLDDVEQATGDLKETLDTLEVSNIELDLARKKAQEASRTKSEFLANMSHELRTPLNSMIGFTKLLQRSELGEHQQDYLTTIRSSAEGLLAMLNSILDFSKLEAGKLELDQTPFNLRELIEQVLVLLAPTAHEKDLELICLIYSDVPLELEADPLRLKQILTNLISNAIKFTDQGHICLRVMLEEEVEGKPLIKLSISDTGIGIAPKQVQRLFRAFAQADPSSTRRMGGTGLGLVISKGLVEMMGGEIGVDSEPGRGSTFWFSFNAALTQTPVGQPALQFQGKRTLLFESSELARTSYQHLLELHGLSVEECQDFQQLQHELKRKDNPIDLVVLSYHPQQLSGCEIEQLLMLIDQHPARFILLCSTKEEQALVRLLAPYPNSLCQAKPLTRAHLNRALKQLLMQPLQSNVSPQLLPPAAAAEPLPLEHAQPHSAPHILAVDDNPANLKLVRVLLLELGARVDTATGGQEALDLAQAETYDLILLDIQMPDLDGLAVTRTLREQPGPNQHSPIIALTAHALAQEKRQLLLAGMDAYLTKPIDEYQLKRVIERWSGCQLLEGETTPASKEAEETEVSTSATEALPLVDAALGQRLAGGKAELAAELLQMLLQDLAKEQRAIATALEECHWPELLERVHKQHGASRYCGVPRLQQACQSAEEALKDANSTEQKRCTLIAQLLQEMAALEHWAAQQEKITQASQAANE